MLIEKSQLNLNYHMPIKKTQSSVWFTPGSENETKLTRFVTLRTFFSGEGKRRNEFAEWHLAWLAEWHNYAEWPSKLKSASFFWRQSICKRSRCFNVDIYDENNNNKKNTKAPCRLAFSVQPQRFLLPLLVGLHGSADTTARKSAIEEKMFWKVTLPST